MAASTKDRKGSDKDKERAAKAKEKERAAKQKEKERAAKAKEKEKAAKEKEKAAKAKEKERAAKQKEKERAAKQKEKERAAKAKEKEKAAKAKEKEKAAKAKDKAARAKQKDKAAKAEQKDRAARRTDEQLATGAGPGAADAPVQAVEETAVEERGETTEVPAEVREAAPAFEVPDFAENDKSVHPKGYLAEVLGKEDLVGRSTQRPTVAASFTTRDHDLIRAWAESRGGRPADVAGTGNKGAGVLRIEFPDGPGDDGRLEDVDWSAFFATFDDSDVDFLYQERVRTGDVSRFHKFVRADA